MYRPFLTTTERFWSSVDKNGPVKREDLGQCWVWTASFYSRGYGRFFFNGGVDGAHRFSYALAHDGDFDRSLHVCHKCDNPPCVRPDHLFLGTCKDNMRDKVAKGRAVINVGADNTNAKLTDRLVIEIRLLARRGLSHERIARNLGMHQSSITRAINGESWKHVKSIVLAEQLSLSGVA